MFSELVMLVCFTMLQHHRGRPPQSPVWVFGMVDVSHKPALGYLEIVPQRDAATLLPIIQAHSNPDTEIWSDEWRAYSQVPSLPNITTHRTVNHSLHFKDPVTPQTLLHSHPIYCLQCTRQRSRIKKISWWDFRPKILVYKVIPTSNE